MLFLAVTLMCAAVSAAPAQAPCDDAAANGISDCQSTLIQLSTAEWQQQSRIVSARLQLDPKRLYWPCCAKDSAGNPSDKLARSVSLVVLPVGSAEGETTIESCSVALAEPNQEERDAIWPTHGPTAAMILGWPSGGAVDREALCAGAQPPTASAGPDAGSLLLISVPADSIPVEPRARP